MMMVLMIRPREILFQLFTTMNAYNGAIEDMVIEFIELRVKDTSTNKSMKNAKTKLNQGRIMEIRSIPD